MQYISKQNGMPHLHVGRSHMYMHNGQRDCTGRVSVRDRVTRDTGRGTMDSTVSESDWLTYHQSERCVPIQWCIRLIYHQSGRYVSIQFIPPKRNICVASVICSVSWRPDPDQPYGRINPEGLLYCVHRMEFT